MNWRALVAASVALACWALPTMGQIVAETTEVTLVEVPVQVTTRAGAPVEGLTIADFELYDRGQLQPISSLEPIDVAASGSHSGEPPSAIRRRILMLFDLTFSRPQAIVKARLAARDYVLSTLGPSDLVAVMIFTLETGPRFLMSFTSDRAQVARALDTLGAPGLLRAARVNDPLHLLLEQPTSSFESGALSSPGRNLGGSSSGDDRSQEVLAHLRSLDRQLARQRINVERSRIAAWSEALSRLARTLADVGGRKHLLYFSEGFDSRLLLGNQGDRAAAPDGAEGESLNAERGELWLNDTGDVFGDVALRQDLRTLVEQLRRADTRVDSIDISGLTTASGRERRGRRETLAAVARGTGGQLYESLNDFAALLERATTPAALTYLLGFQPRDLEWDGSFHELEVRLTNPRGYRVSHRTGYYAPRPFEALHPLEKSLLAADAVVTASPRHDLRLDVLVAAFHSGAEAFYVPVILEIEGRSLLYRHRSPQLVTELFAYVTDERGTIRDFFNHRVVLDLAKARQRLLATGLKFYGHLSLPAGRYQVRVLARNAETGLTTVRTVALEISDANHQAPRLLPPFFVEQRESWVLAREPVTEERLIYPFTIRGSPFVPAIRPRVLRGETAELLLMAYGLGATPLTVEGKILTGGDSSPPDLRLELVERLTDGVGGRVQLLVRFQPGGLPAGSYTLEVAVNESASGLSVSSFVPVQVE